MRMKNLLSLFLALVMVLSLVPTTVFATEGETEDVVYISVSFDGQYINDKNGDPIVYVPVSFDEIETIDLEEYDLSDYLYDPDGDGTYETTALQLIIYAHENIYGGSWSDVTFTGGAGSSYFQGGIFGFTENLNYFLNGEFPIDEELAQTSPNASGATSDHIILEAGDFLDLASFTSYAFLWDSNAGFHLFADGNGSFVHNYTAEAGEDVEVKLLRSYSNMADGSAVLTDEANYEIYYGTTFGAVDGTVTTDDSGCATLNFDAAGTYYLWVNGGYGLDAAPEDIVSSPAYATVTVTVKPRVAQDVSEVLDATMEELAATVTAPVFGTTAGEWTVFSLARGGYYAKDNAYFADYYDRIVDTVEEQASLVNLDGALHASKSTDNSRLIVALSSIGKNATSVGNWDLTAPYDDFTWVKKQGLNGVIWTLIALDSNGYAADTAIRETCVSHLLENQHDDGGWSLMANKTLASDPDITGMALTALYPYRNDEDVAAACEKAFDCLSEMQHDNGTFASGGSECAESCAWVIVATTTWGINPDTDSRFIKNDKSVVDALLSHYVEDEAMFQHIIGAGSNAMATDQATYALVAYDRFINGDKALFDYSDVTFDAVTEPTDKAGITLGLPEKVENEVGKTFNAVLSINQWDNEANYKLIDFIMSVPAGLSVSEVKAGSNLVGGEVRYHLDDEGYLRAVYFDSEENSNLTLSTSTFPAELFTVTFCIEQKLENVEELNISVDGMSFKCSSDSSDKDSMVVIDTTKAGGSVEVEEGVSFSAVCLYEGDDVDLIPKTKKAVAVAVTGLKEVKELTYNDGTNQILFHYSAEITNKSGVHTYVALVDVAIPMADFVEKDHFTLTEKTAPAAITFGDSNEDGIVNAQDALAAVDAWLRKTDAPEGKEILTLNVNGDNRINTFDALGIVEKFVNKTEYGVVTKAATITTKK